MGWKEIQTMNCYPYELRVVTNNGPVVLKTFITHADANVWKKIINKYRNTVGISDLTAEPYIINKDDEDNETNS
jgi:hypothetical protein